MDFLAILVWAFFFSSFIALHIVVVADLLLIDENGMHWFQDDFRKEIGGAKEKEKEREGVRERKGERVGRPGQWRERERERERERQIDRQRDRHRERDRQTDR